MKNKKGFTLIELLAVIVVLAIIALIATPIVMNTIKNAKKGAAERTADNYIKQVETAVAEAKLENKTVPNGTYDIDEDGNLTGAKLPNGKLEINMSGNKPTSGTVKISNGGVSQEGTKLVVGDYNVKYKNDKLTASEPYKGVLCKAVTNAMEGNVPNGNFDYGDEYICDLGDTEDSKNLRFWVLDKTDSDVLLLSKNLSQGDVSWISIDDWTEAGGIVTDAMKNNDRICAEFGKCATNEFGPITVNKALKERTLNWTRLDDIQITLPTGEQIAKLLGKTFSEQNGCPDCDFNNQPDYLIQHIFWTSTPVKSALNNSAWLVDGNGGFHSIPVHAARASIRSVITIPKSQLG